MNTLTSVLRRQLEKAVEQARVAAELGARQSLEALAVHHHEPWGAMDGDQRALRRRLRAHGRQLGDSRNSQSGLQDLDRLTEEVAYEFWHRMLFARFLAENELLMYPDPEHPVAVSLEECEQLAGEEGAANGWELAARFAARMLPQIFRLDSPVFQLALPPEHQQKLERLVAGLPTEIFSASDSLGWVYQFWQSRKKEAVNAAGEKIGATELPAVTQLFTEPYMVSLLLDNSLGAWWAARTLSDDDLRKADTEQELRDKAAIPGVSLEYLRFVQQEDGAWTPAAGTFDTWPEQLAELKTLDPCCGSGHFLVAAFLMLVPMRIERDGLSAQEAVDAVLRENLHGLELDKRCVELAAFALALSAWTYPHAGAYRALPELNLACSGLSVAVAKEEWKNFGLGKKNLAIALGHMHDIFKDASVLGSLLNPVKAEAAKIVRSDELIETLQQALQAEKGNSGEEEHEVVVAAQGLAKAAELLADQYRFVITNVPYLARNKQSERLQVFCDKYYHSAKNDLATVFLERCLEFLCAGGTACAVSTQNWMFLKSYKGFRKKMLASAEFNMVGKLGGGAEAFENGPGNITNIAVIAFSSKTDHTREGLFYKNKNFNLISGMDVSQKKNPEKKAAFLIVSPIQQTRQSSLLESDDSEIILTGDREGNRLGKYAYSYQGIKSGDDGRHRRQFWEINQVKCEWVFLQSTVAETVHFGGLEYILDWSNEGHNLARRQGLGAWGKKGIAVSQMGYLPCALYIGRGFDSNICPVIPADGDHLAALWSYAESGQYKKAIREIDQKMAVANATMLKPSINLDYWHAVAKKKYPTGLPKPYSDNPTQWIFHGHPCASVVWNTEQKRTTEGFLRADETVLQVAVARLLGYRWPGELDEEIELANEQRICVKRCESLLSFADEDCIVCIPAVRGEASASDRVKRLLEAAYGDAWSDSIERELLAASSVDGRAASSLDQWLRESFFAQHCKFFYKRPFIWHIWDGRKDGFHAMVNYHKLAGPNGVGRRTLESLAYGYLGEWISRQRTDQQNEVEGADARLAAALTLQGELEKILEGEPPYDLFIRWKPLHEQPVGWNPDINDGVRLNIRPFVLAADVGLKGAGILRGRVDNTWSNTKKVGAKDRGKEAESMRPREDFPWFWGCNPEKFIEHRTDFGAPTPDAPPAEKKFDGHRWNNLHYTRAAREAARVRKGEQD